MHMFDETALRYNQNLIESLQSGRKWVCFGAGRYFSEFIKKYCVERKLLPFPQCCFDSSAALEGSKILSIPIRNPIELKQKEYDDAVIVISTVLPYSILSVLNTSIYRGYSAILPMIQLDTYLCYISRKEDFYQVYEKLADEKSKYVYKGYLSAILSGSCHFPLFYSPEPYWNNDVIGKPRDGDSIVYAGVFKGEQLDRLLKLSPNVTVHGYEPNKYMYEKLLVKYEGLHHVHLYNYGLSDRECVCQFLDSQGPSSRSITVEESQRLNMQKDKHVSTIKLQSMDNMISDKVDLIALDIEGAEPEALRGSRCLISKYHPHLGICVYHKIEHYVEIPQLILELAPEYRLHFRQHSMAPAESVIYAI